MCTGLDAPREFRALLMGQGLHQFDAGDLDGALATLARARSMTLPDPDPLGDIDLAVGHTAVLLVAGRSADMIADAGQPGLDAADAWGIDNAGVAYTQSNVAAGLRLAGRVADAATIIDPVTDETPTQDRSMRALRAGDPGRTARPVRRRAGTPSGAGAVPDHDPGQPFLNCREPGHGRTVVRPGRCRTDPPEGGHRPRLGTPTSRATSRECWPSQHEPQPTLRTLPVRAPRPGRTGSRISRRCMRSCRVDPFAPAGELAARTGLQRTWHAELARLSGKQTSRCGWRPRPSGTRSPARTTRRTAAGEPPRSLWRPGRPRWRQRLLNRASR